MVIKIESKDKEVPKFPLFEYDGETYYIDPREKPALLLQYLYQVRVAGPGVAESWLGEELLGPEAYTVLINIPGIDAEQIGEVLGIARELAFGNIVVAEDGETTEPVEKEKPKAQKKPARKAQPRKRT